MNREVENSGLQMTAEGAPFELKTSGTTGLYDSLLDGVIAGYSNDSTTGSSVGIKWRLVKNTAEINNVYAGNGTPTAAEMAEITRRDSSDYGLKPGDSGVLQFSIVPKDANSMNIQLNLDVTGYKATFGVDEYKTNAPLQVVSNSTINHYLNSHILFFYKGIDNKKHLLTSEGYTVAVSAETPISLYWVWPATLKEILDANIDSLDDISSKEVRMLFFEKPEYFLKPQGSETFNEFKVQSMTDKVAEETAIQANLSIVNGRDYNTYGTMYNDADQAIGDNVNYILVDLTAIKNVQIAIATCNF